MPQPPRGALGRHAVRNRNRLLAIARAAASLGVQAARNPPQAPRSVLATDRAAVNVDSPAARTTPPAQRVVLATTGTSASPRRRADRRTRRVLATARASAHTGGPAARTVLQAPRPSCAPSGSSEPAQRAPGRRVVASAPQPDDPARRGQPRGISTPRRGCQARHHPYADPRLPCRPEPHSQPLPSHVEADAARVRYHVDLAVDRAVHDRRHRWQPQHAAPLRSPAHLADLERLDTQTRLVHLEANTAGLLILLGSHSQAIHTASARIFDLEAAPTPPAPPAPAAASVAQRLQAASEYQPGPLLDLRPTLAGAHRPARDPARPSAPYTPALFGSWAPAALQPPPWAQPAVTRTICQTAHSSRPPGFLVSSLVPGRRPPPPATERRIHFREGSGLLRLGSPSSRSGYAAPIALPPPPTPGSPVATTAPPPPPRPDGGA